MEYNFIITLQDGTVLNPGNPKGWDNLELVLQLTDNLEWVVEFSSTLGYSDTTYQVLRDFIKGTDAVLDPGNPCSINQIEIQGRCNDYEDFRTILIAIWSGKDITLDCTTCEAEIKPSDTGGIQRLLESAGQEFEISTQNLDLFEVESGTLFDDQAGFVTILDFLQSYGQSLGVTIQSSVLSTPFQQHITEFTPPATGPGDTLEYIIETSLGDIFRFEINDAGTSSDNAYRFKVLTAQDPNINPGVCWLARKISNVEILVFGIAAGRTTMYTNYQIIGFQELLNGVDTGQVLTEIQAYQYGLENLAISTKGLLANRPFRHNYTKIMELLRSFAPFSVRELDGVVYIDPEPIQYENIGLPTIDIQVDNYTETIEKDWLCGKLNIGQDFEIEDAEESIENWAWKLPQTKSDIKPLNDPSFEWSGPSGNTPGLNPSVGTYSYLAGNVAFTGSIVLDTDFAGVVGLEISINGNVVKNINFISTGATTGYNWINDGSGDPYIFESLEEATICLDPGDGPHDYELNFIGTGGGVVQSDTTTLEISPLGDLNLQIIDDGPDLREQFHDNKPEFDLTTYGCSEVCPIRLSGDYYALYGFGLSQQVKELADYDDKYFLSFIDPVEEEVKLFEVAEYKPNNCSTNCNDYRVNCYYNIPLQAPFVALNYAPIIPQNIDTEGFDITFTWSVDGCLANATILPSNNEYQRTRTSVCLKNAKDLCLNVDDIRGLLAELRANITTACDGQTFAARWNQINFSFVDGSATAIFRPLN